MGREGGIMCVRDPQYDSVKGSLPPNSNRQVAAEQAQTRRLLESLRAAAEGESV